MKNEFVNIFAKEEIIFKTLSSKNKYFNNFKFIFFTIDDLKKKSNNDNLNIIFVPFYFKKNDCKIIMESLKKININNTIICIEKKLSSQFASYKDCLLFLPVSFVDLEKKTNLIKISSILNFKNIKFNRKNNVLVNTNNKMNVNLTLIEANILDILIVEKKGASKSLINSKALGQAKNVDSHSIDSHIYRLRKKLDFIKSKIKIVVINKGLYQIL